MIHIRESPCPLNYVMNETAYLKGWCTAKDQAQGHAILTGFMYEKILAKKSNVQ